VTAGTPTTTFLAHGLGGSADLPIPFSYALVGAAWALTASFAVLAFAWRTPRLDPDAPGYALPDRARCLVDSAVIREVLGWLALVFTGWVAIVAFFGSQRSDADPLPGVVYVLWWVGLVACSVVFGPVWRIISPVRTVHRLLCRLARRSPDAALVRYPESWGYRSAVVGLFAFVWLELAAPDPGSLSAMRTWCLLYLAVTRLGTVLCGTRWCERTDPFEVYSTLASRLSAVGRRGSSGPVVLRRPLDHLGSMAVRSGSVALMATLLGSTVFDSFSAQPWWRDVVDELSADSPLPSSVTAVLLRTVGLSTVILFVGGSFWFAARATGGLDRRQRAALPGQLSHALIPIVIGYVFAHYLTYLVEKGQATLILLAAPLGLGDLQVSYLLSGHPRVLASIKVGSVLLGHVLGVIAAHDRSLRLLPRTHQLTGQLTLLLTMVTYTFGGLCLLFGG